MQSTDSVSRLPSLFYLTGFHSFLFQLSAQDRGTFSRFCESLLIFFLDILLAVGYRLKRFQLPEGGNTRKRCLFVFFVVLGLGIDDELFDDWIVEQI